MIPKKTLEDIKKQLIEAYNPLAIYLFGSYGWGHPDEESDLDILIVVEKSELKRSKRARSAFEILYKFKIPNDVIVYTKDEFDERADDITTLGYKIKHDGKLIYAKS